ncbi:MAG: hypothetical protein EA419_08170 [Wenzhouxiangella sp.]|nr:MAG: hypothetical protein EA419_08170 [Wenzhouxiangella sp.]
MHQGRGISFVGESTMDASMKPPLIWMIVATKLLFTAALLDRSRNELVEQDRRKGWVRQKMGASA